MSAPFCSAIRFALVGCGGIARHHLRAILGADHPATVAALVDTRKKNAEELLRLLPSEQAKSCQVGHLAVATKRLFRSRIFSA